MEASEAVRPCHDDWIEVPGETVINGASAPLKLRTGRDEGKVRIDPLYLEGEVDIAQLREGLDLIEQEHRR